MKKRMSLAQDEISHFLEYDYVVINDDVRRIKIKASQ